MISIVTGDARPIFKQVVEGIRLKIATGEIAPEFKLPSVRGLAMQLMVNPNTIAKAYAELTAQGLVESRAGLGLFVAAPRNILTKAERKKRLDDASRQFINEVVHLGFSAEELTQKIQQELSALPNSEK